MVTIQHQESTLFLVPQVRVDALGWEPLPGSRGVEHRAVYLGERVVAGQLRMAPGGGEAAHLHGRGEHHLWVLSGAVVIDDTRLEAGSYVHVPAHVLHELVDAGAGSLLLYVSTGAGASRP